MRHCTRCVLGCVAGWLLLVTTASTAAPAPWYWWASRSNSQRLCAQHMPSAGWMRAEGPFTNAQCQPARSSLLHGMRVPAPVQARHGGAR